MGNTQKKQRKRHKFRHNVNRKRLRNKISNPGSIACTEVKEAWNVTRSVKYNLSNMGLSFDPNVTLCIKPEGVKEQVIESDFVPSSTSVAEKLEQEANAPRVRMFKLPNSQVQWITYLMDTYGSDYKAMVKDRKNYYQETWKQLRAKIRRFKSVPEQYSEYLKSRGLPDVEEAVVSSDSDEL